ncbi:MAG: helix-turn-helix transcriptional regulator [Phormidesmis sp.]
MQAADIPSYRLLSERAGVSRWQIQQLKTGHIKKMRLVSLIQIAAALGISFADLYVRFEPVPSKSQSESQSKNSLETSDRNALPIDPLQTAALQTTALQTTALETLESWLVQWPTIAKRAQDRPDLPAAKILPYVRPVEQLMSEWGVEPIAAVDSQTAYDPTYHQLTAGQAEPGDLVRVTHTGITHRGNLLHRARVKPV